MQPCGAYEHDAEKSSEKVAENDYGSGYGCHKQRPRKILYRYQECILYGGFYSVLELCLQRKRTF